MNTNQLKKFAQEARRKLIDQVSAKLNYVLTSDTAELREKSSSINKLKEALKETSKEQLIDKVSPNLTTRTKIRNKSLSEFNKKT